MKRPELLAPAGSFEKAKVAFMYGADAVYCGTGKLSLRSRAEVDDDDLVKTIQYAHSIGKKVYAALNIYAFDENYEEIKNQIELLDEVNVDAIIVSDGGVVNLIKEIAPNIDIHISTQANVVSLNSANFWYQNGATRVILGRELSKDQIEHIMNHKMAGLQVEMFIHGALCWAYSGRCFLSDYLSSRSANLGDCSQSCRWAYNLYLEEKNNPGNMMPVETDENGTYILSSKDLCLIKRLPEIIEMGVDSLKIEGRLKTEYYLASVVNTYRNAIDDYMENPDGYDYRKYLKELEKVKTRGLTEFYFEDRKNKDFQEYEGKQYNPNYEFGGIVVEDCKANEIVTIEIRNKLSVGDILEVLVPKTSYKTIDDSIGKSEVEKKVDKIISEKKDVKNSIELIKEFEIKEMFDCDNNAMIDTVNPGKTGQKVKLRIPQDVQEGWIIRRKK